MAKIQQDLPFLNSRPATISSSRYFLLASRRNIMVFVIRSTKNSRNLRFDDPHATFPSINRIEKDISNLAAISLDEKKSWRSNKSKNYLILLKLITGYIDKSCVSRNTILEYYLARLDFDPFGGIVEPKYKEECRIFFLLCANEKNRTTDFSLGTFPVHFTSVGRTFVFEERSSPRLNRNDTYHAIFLPFSARRDVVATDARLDSALPVYFHARIQHAIDRRNRNGRVRR